MKTLFLLEDILGVNVYFMRILRVHCAVSFVYSHNIKLWVSFSPWRGALCRHCWIFTFRPPPATIDNYYYCSPVSSFKRQINFLTPEAPQRYKANQTRLSLQTSRHHQAISSNQIFLRSSRHHSEGFIPAAHIRFLRMLWATRLN